MTSLLEELAELEHKQWMSWSKYLYRMGEVSKDKVRRWKENSWKPYNELTEAQKKMDRKWARKVLAIVEKYREGLR